MRQKKCDDLRVLTCLEEFPAITVCLKPFLGKTKRYNTDNYTFLTQSPKCVIILLFQLFLYSHQTYFSFSNLRSGMHCFQVTMFLVFKSCFGHPAWSVRVKVFHEDTVAWSSFPQKCTFADFLHQNQTTDTSKHTSLSLRQFPTHSDH